MNLLGRLLLQKFIERYADARSQIESWEAEIEKAQWNTPHDLRARYSSASIVKGQVIFNICDNRYRLWVRVNYKNKTVLIRKIGTHNEYNKWDIC